MPYVAGFDDGGYDGGFDGGDDGGYEGGFLGALGAFAPLIAQLAPTVLSGIQKLIGRGGSIEDISAYVDAVMARGERPSQAQFLADFPKGDPKRRYRLEGMKKDGSVANFASALRAYGRAKNLGDPQLAELFGRLRMKYAPRKPRVRTERQQRAIDDFKRVMTEFKGQRRTPQVRAGISARLRELADARNQLDPEVTRRLGDVITRIGTYREKVPDKATRLRYIAQARKSDRYRELTGKQWKQARSLGAGLDGGMVYPI